jgi:N-acyl-D-amino-acid deacylase
MMGNARAAWILRGARGFTAACVLVLAGCGDDVTPGGDAAVQDLSLPRDLTTPTNPDALAACEAALLADWAANTPSTGFASPTSAASYDPIITQIMRDFALPGGAVAVVQNGRLVFAKGYGFSDSSAPELVNPDDRFRVASLSKALTSAEVLKLVEAGQLNLDENAFAIISDLQPLPGKTINPQLASITVRHLLEHRGGWNRDSTFDPMFRSIAISQALGQPGPATCEDTIRYMLDQPLQYTPGSTMCYSNFGYCVLGRIIERRSGTTYAQAVTQTVLTPLGAGRIAQGKTLPSLRADNEVLYYDFPGASLATSVFPPNTAQVPWPYGGWYLEAMDSHGAWIASAVDHLRFQVGIDGRATPPDLLSAASETAMLENPNVPTCTPTNGTTPASATSWYGMGWAVNSAGNYWHNGSLDGTTTETVVAKNGYGWSAFFNSRPQNSNALASRLDQDLWTAFNGAGSWIAGDAFDQYGAFTAWLSAMDYGAAVGEQHVAGRWPSRIEGRLTGGAWQFRAEFVPEHAGVDDASAVGLDCVAFRAAQAQRTQAGYLLVSLQSFVDENGLRRFQAAWSQP